MSFPPASPKQLARCLVIIGASTGGTRTLPVIFDLLPPLPAAVLIVQHMPKFINESLARTLSRHARQPVRIVEEGDDLTEGDIFLVPSETHCVISEQKRLHLVATPPVNYVRPAIDVTMESLSAPSLWEKLISVVLTGMGKDGANGLAHMKKLGALTLSQNKETCAVYGMPAAAAATGCVDYVLPPESIARVIRHEIGRWHKAQASS